MRLDQWVDRLGDAPADADARSLFDEHSEHHVPASADCFHQKVLQLIYADVPRAARYATAARWLADTGTELTLRAVASRCEGHIAYVQSRTREAVDAYRAALHLYDQAGRDVDAARTQLGALQALSLLGRYDEALEWTKRAREVFTRSGDRLRLARLESNAGNILFRQDRHAEALQCYERAYDVLCDQGEPRDVGAVLSNMAVCYTILGRLEHALKWFHRALDYCDEHGLPSLVAAADYNIAYLHFLRGDYVAALKLYGATRIRCEQAGDRYHAALCDLDESEMYLELNLISESLHLAERAAAAFAEQEMAYEEAKARVTQAIAKSYGGDSRRARAGLAAARRLFVREKNRVWPSLIDLYQAILFSRTGEDAKARFLLGRASKVLASSPIPGKAALCASLFAQLLLKAGQPAEARVECSRALDNLGEDATPPVRFHLLFVLGQAAEAENDWPAAHRHYQAARAELEDLRSRLWGEEPRIAILRTKLVVYERLVRIALRNEGVATGSLEDVFECIQQAKSRSLADQLALQRPRRSESPDEVERIRDIRSNLNWYYRQIELSALLERVRRPDSQVGALRRQASEQEAELRQLLAVSQGAEEFSGRGPSLAETQECLPKQAQLVEYFDAGGVLLAGVLDREGFRVHELGTTAAAIEHARLLHFQLAKFSLGGRYAQHFLGEMERCSSWHLRELYEILIRPIERHLTSYHLVIAPHGFLHDVPFQALQCDGEHLIDRHTISYAPSARVFALCQARGKGSGQGSLVLAVPETGAPHILEEARTAAKLLPDCMLLLGDEATEENFRAQAPGVRYLHVATHGLFRRDNPMFSSIRLGRSHLTLIDLYQIPLQADLVTLSGCSTGRSGVVGADELLGLMRGLLHAGARRLLLAQWDVNDQSTASFMGHFYRSISEGHGAAAAVREASLETRKRYPHPFYWAPFALVGQYLE